MKILIDTNVVLDVLINNTEDFTFGSITAVTPEQFIKIMAI
jgi:predicted nucleic acid-binding protein